MAAFDTFVEATSTTASQLMPALTTAGPNEFGIFGIVTNGGPVTSITGGTGITWINRISQLDIGSGTTLEIWFAQFASALAGVQFTVNTTSSAFINAALMAFTGVTGGATPYDPSGTLPTFHDSTGTMLVNTANAADVVAVFGGNHNFPALTPYTSVYAANFFTVGYLITPSLLVNSNPFNANIIAVADAYMQGSPTPPASAGVLGLASAEW